MIFKLTFPDKQEFAQAKGWSHLFDEYQKKYGREEFLRTTKVSRITLEQAKSIMLRNNEYNEDLPESGYNVKEYSLFEIGRGTNFLILGTTDCD
ncbi:hypothetical protein [Flavobacterium sp. HNIBRBA15423]|uniref:hypothetical protein n=1 Tax=Flavobacterium sp. HNIBRBA15423 TaxID=3458683 RepID=UPI004044AC34